MKWERDAFYVAYDTIREIDVLLTKGQYGLWYIVDDVTYGSRTESDLQNIRGPFYLEVN